MLLIYSWTLIEKEASSHHQVFIIFKTTKESLFHTLMCLEKYEEVLISKSFFMWNAH